MLAQRAFNRVSGDTLAGTRLAADRNHEGSFEVRRETHRVDHLLPQCSIVSREVRSLDYVVEHKIGNWPDPRLAPDTIGISAAMPGPHAVTPNISSPTGPDVAQAVADDRRPARVDRQLGKRLAQQQGAGLATFAANFERSDLAWKATFGVVRTEVNSIK